MYSIENEFLKIEIHPSGAELQSIVVKKNNKEFLWQGDPSFWSRRAPLLFPIVGRLAGDRMFYKGKEYKMSQHGFARDIKFSKESGTDSSISLSCESDLKTRESYPFDWQLTCKYLLDGNQLKVSAKVTNTSVTDPMYFSIGYHPAFIVPMDDHLSFEDYYLKFNDDDQANKWKITDALIDKPDGPGMQNGMIKFTNDTFLHDALVFKGLKSNTITLQSDRAATKLIFTCDNYPFIGIWSKPGAAFVCIEPWHGIADSTMHDGDFEKKEGIKYLEPGEDFVCGYEIEITQ